MAKKLVTPLDKLVPLDEPHDAAGIPPVNPPPAGGPASVGSSWVTAPQSLAFLWLFVGVLFFVAIGPVLPSGLRVLTVPRILTLGLILAAAVGVSLRAPTESRRVLGWLALVHGALALVCATVAIAIQPPSGTSPRDWTSFLAFCYGIFGAFLWRTKAAKDSAPARGFDLLAPMLGVAMLTLGTLWAGPLFPQKAQQMTVAFIAAVSGGLGLLTMGTAMLFARRSNAWFVALAGVALWLALCCGFLGTQVWLGNFRMGKMREAVRTEGSDQRKSDSSGPAITRVEVGANKAVIEGRGAPDAKFVFQVGKDSLKCFIHDDSPFTATIERAWWGRGLNFFVKDSRGKVLLNAYDNKVGPMTEQRRQIVFRAGTRAPESDGSFILGEFRPETGAPVPIAVRLEKLGTPSAEIPTPPDSVPAPTR